MSSLRFVLFRLSRNGYDGENSVKTDYKVENLIIFPRAKGDCKLFVLLLPYPPPQKNTCFYLASPAPKSSRSDLFCFRDFFVRSARVILLESSAILNGNKHTRYDIIILFYSNNFKSIPHVESSGPS